MKRIVAMVLKVAVMTTVIVLLVLLVVLNGDGQDDFQSQNRIQMMGKEKAYIAALFHNIEDILPVFIENLVGVVIPAFSQVFISIYENGSTDKTKQLLIELSEKLSMRGVQHNITMSNARRPPHEYRIKYLAQLRNYALYNFYHPNNRS